MQFPQYTFQVDRPSVQLPYHLSSNPSAYILSCLHTLSQLAITALAFILIHFLPLFNIDLSLQSLYHYHSPICLTSDENQRS